MTTFEFGELKEIANASLRKFEKGSTEMGHRF